MVLAIAIWAFGAFDWILMLPVVRGVRRLWLRRSGGRRLRLAPHVLVRILSVPASLGLGMLIAHFLY